MNNYIATFFSHFDALTFYSALKSKNITAKLMPVPRKLSASCGTCVFFATDLELDFENYEIEGVYTDSSGVYQKTWGCED